MKKWTCLLLSLILVFCAAGGALAETTKDETVYVLANAEGEAKRVIVSDWLTNPDGEKDLADATTLKDAKAVKGSAFLKDGVWYNADGADVYYQGDAEDALPGEPDRKLHAGRRSEDRRRNDRKERPRDHPRGVRRKGDEGRRKGAVRRADCRAAGQRRVHEHRSHQRQVPRRRRSYRGRGLGAAGSSGNAEAGRGDRDAARIRGNFRGSEELRSCPPR